MAGKSQVLPVEAWVRSSIMERKLEELVHDGLLRPRASRGVRRVVHLFKAEHFAKKAGERGVRQVVHAGSCTLHVRAG
jgi:hypothetical protein